MTVPLEMDTHKHSAMVGQLHSWAAAHQGARIAADIVVGAQSRRVADGPIVRIDEHPSREGVFRIVFDSHLYPSVTETGQDAVMFGWEVTDVTETPLGLEIDKGGAQKVVLIDLTVQHASEPTRELVSSAAVREAAPPPVRTPPPVVPAAAPPQLMPPPLPAPPAAPPPVRRPWLRTPAGRIVVTLLAIVAVVFAAFVLLGDNLGVNPEPTPNPGAGEEQPSALAAFTPAERRLLRHVPWAVTDCQPATASAPARATASVVCEPAGSQTEVRYSRYGSKASLQDAWDDMHDRINADGSGVTDREYGTWCALTFGACLASDGYTVFYRTPDRVVTKWTHEEMKVLAEAHRNDGRMKALREFWRAAGPTE